jgi:hypothetical protein
MNEPEYNLQAEQEWAEMSMEEMKEFHDYLDHYQAESNQQQDKDNESR